MIDIREILEPGMVEVRRQPIFKTDTDIDLIRENFKEVFMYADQTVNEYVHLPEYEKVIEWIKDNKGTGLMMAGSYGRGKSIILTSVIPVLYRSYYNKILVTVSARNLHKQADYIKQWAYSIDDIGQDTLYVKDFGTTDYPLINIVSEAEDKLKLMILTTNLTKKELIAKYGDRIMDRINRLCYLVQFSGESLRRSK